MKNMLRQNIQTRKSEYDMKHTVSEKILLSSLSDINSSGDVCDHTIITVYVT